MRTYLLITFFHLLLFSGFSQMNGTYTIGGTTPDFLTFNEAVNSLLSNGVAGPVTFNVRSGVYTERITLVQIVGSSPTNLITFQSESGNANDVILQHAHGWSTNPFNVSTISFDGADNFVFKQLTIKSLPELPTSTGNSRVIMIANNANNIRFENNRIESFPVTDVQDAKRNVIHIGKDGAPTSNNDSILILNNEIVNGWCGVEYIGWELAAGAYQSSLLQIEGNTFSGQIESFIQVNTMAHVLIRDNKMTEQNNAAAFIAIDLDYIQDSLVIERNQIELKDGGIGVDLANITAGTNNYKLLANNMIAIGPDYTSGNVYGINAITSQPLIIAYNSILVKSTASTRIALRCNADATIYNNQLVNLSGGNAINYSSTFSITSNYNNLYSTGSLCNLGATLNDIFINTGNDEFSISTDPNFLAYNNLIPLNPLVYELGVPFGSISTDIYGTSRSLVSPDMGAYEGSAPLNEVALTFTNIGLIQACPGDVVPVYAKVTNLGTNNLTSVEIDFLGSIISWTGNIIIGEESDSIYLGDLTVPLLPMQELTIWTQNPNGVPDLLNANDTLVSILYPGLAGAYSVGGVGSDFENLTELAQILNNGFLCAPVVFNIEPGTYTEQVQFTNVAGSSLTNTVTIQSVALDSSSVIIEHSSTGSGNLNYTLQFFDNQYFTLQHVTVKALNTTNNRAVYINAADNFTLQNCVIEANVSAYTTSRKLVELYTSVSYPADSLTIQQNRFVKGGYQLYLTSTQHAVILGNSFDGPAGYTMELSGVSNSLIAQNTFSGTRTAPCIQMGGVSLGNRIERNSFNTTGSNVLGLTFANGTAIDPIQITNNFITCNNMAMNITSSTFLEVLNNSFCMTSASANVRINNAYDAFTFYNNIFKTSGGRFYHFQSVAVDSSKIDSDNNGYFTTGVQEFYANGPIYNLNGWQTAFGLDTLSFFADPQYFSNSDLHINNAIEYENTGMPLAEITVDIDNEVRSLLTPDVGADEFVFDSGTYHDIAYAGLLQPDTAQCILYDSLIIRVANNSTFTIDSLIIEWWMFDTKIDSAWHYVSIPSMDTAEIFLAAIDFNHNTAYDFDLLLSLPNGNPDNLQANNEGQALYYFLENTTIFERDLTDCTNEIELSIKEFPRSTILWSTGSTEDSIVVPASPGTYTVTVTHSNGCIVTDTITLN